MRKYEMYILVRKGDLDRGACAMVMIEEEGEELHEKRRLTDGLIGEVR